MYYNEHEPLKIKAGQPLDRIPPLEERPR